jgi:hypothetical protein
MTPLTMSSHLVRVPDLLSADMDGDLVMMSVESGEYYGVGGVGPRIWELLEQPITVDAIVAVICAEFEVEETRCREDVLTFARQLVETGLVRLAA